MSNRGSFLATNQALQAGDGDYLVSENQAYVLMMQTDGNLCIYAGSAPDHRTGPALWASNSQREQEAYFVIMQADGNLCIYAGADPDHQTGDALWSSNSVRGDGEYFAHLLGDGNFCVYTGANPDHQEGDALWASGSTQATASATPGNATNTETEANSKSNTSSDTAQAASPSHGVVRLTVASSTSRAAGISPSDSSSSLNLWQNITHIVKANTLNLSVDGHSFAPQITTVALQATLQTEEGGPPADCYYIQQTASINPSGCYVRNESTCHGWYAINYTFNTYPRDFKGDSTNFRLEQTSPDTTTGATSVTSGITYSLGGNVGFFGDTPTGGVNAGVSISNSHTISIPDVSITNQSNDAGNNGKWLYAMPEQGVAGALDTSLHAPVAMSISNFQPAMYMVWIARERGQGSAITFVTEFNATLEMTELDWHFVEATVKRYTRKCTGQFTFDVSFPPPPQDTF